jgi:hypothetical protein
MDWTMDAGDGRWTSIIQVLAHEILSKWREKWGEYTGIPILYQTYYIFNQFNNFERFVNNTISLIKTAL